MKQIKVVVSVASIAVAMLLAACTSSSVDRIGSGEIYSYMGKNFGTHRTASFKRGVVDGCATAAGDYRKDHVAFHEDEHYRMGWGDGRLQCYNINKEKEK